MASSDLRFLGQCRNLRFTSASLHGYRLDNHVIRTNSVINEDFCQMQCCMEPNCISYNFKMKEEANGQHKCDLNNPTYEHGNEHSGDLSKNETYAYREAENACAKKPCQNNSTCQAGLTDRDYQCLCISGFNGHDCENDIGECTKGSHSCHVNAVCINIKGSYNCTCKAGFPGDGRSCTDIDECAIKTDKCDDNAVCNNTQGCYLCTCKEGFYGSGKNCIVLPEPFAFYPLDGEYRAAEKENKQPSGIPGTVTLIVGPYNESTGAYNFFGNNTSYIKFPTVGFQPHSITLMCWVQPGGQDGPLFNYGQTDHGVGIWINRNGKFYHEMRGQVFTKVRIDTDASLAVGEWVHVAATYNHKTGENSLYINGVLNKSQNIGTAHLISTHGLIALMGVKGDGYFKGKIAQMKIYDAALDGAQIMAAINQECEGALGMESGAITNAQITASSILQDNAVHAASHARLNFHENPNQAAGAWAANARDDNPWLQVDLGAQCTKVRRVATQGRNSLKYSQWVTKYKLQYGDKNEEFQYYREPGQDNDEIFAGNTDQDSLVYHDLNPPVTSQYIRFVPVDYHLHISMRVELYGCVQGWYSGQPGRSCKHIRDSGGSRGDGEYWIDPERSGNPLKVFCDMTTDGGGWLLVSNAVIDSSSSIPELSRETTYRGIENCHNSKTFLEKDAMNELRTHLSLTQLRFHCSKQPGRTFHVTTVTNSTGEAVVQYFSGQTDVQPDACGSFVRMENDNSRLARVCHRWGHNGTSYKVGKWGHARDKNSLYDHAAFIAYFYHWLLTPGGSRWECDDFNVGVSSGDFWKVFVR